MAWTPELTRSRKALDHRLLTAMVCEAMPSVEAYLDARCRQRASEEQALAGLTEKYVVTMRSPAIDASRRRIPEVKVSYGIPASSYPHGDPRVVVVSQPLPFTSHVQSPTGLVCIGTIWEMAQGRLMLAALVHHVARLFNFDENEHKERGFDNGGFEFWRDELRFQPLDPTFQYPTPPLDLIAAPAAPKPRLVLRRKADDAGSVVTPPPRRGLVLGRRP